MYIAHGGHCTKCDDIALAFVTYLSLTGRCKCFVDFCASPKEFSSGVTKYYEHQIKRRKKVIVLCTTNEDELERNDDQENPEG